MTAARVKTELWRWSDPALRCSLSYDGGQSPACSGQCQRIVVYSSQGSATLARLSEMATSPDIELRLARVKTDMMEVLQRDGVIDMIGESRFFGTVYGAAADRMPDISVSKAGLD
jgi:hypothetical protein